MARYADDILPAPPPVPQWHVRLLATVTAVVGACSFALAVARSFG